MCVLIAIHSLVPLPYLLFIVSLLLLHSSPLSSLVPCFQREQHTELENRDGGETSSEHAAVEHASHVLSRVMARASAPLRRDSIGQPSDEEEKQSEGEEEEKQSKADELRSACDTQKCIEIRDIIHSLHHDAGL